MTTPDLRALKELAEAATPGPWRWGDWRTTFGLLESDFRLTLERNSTYGAEPGPVRRNRGDGCIRILSAQDEIDPANAAYIAAANPTAILSLLSQLEAARAEVERLTGAGFAAYNPATVAGIIDERDAARGELERCKAERDAYRDRFVENGKGFENLLARAERDVAEAIAAWLDRRDETAARAGTTAEDYLFNVARDIRAGQWKPTPTRGDS